MTLLLVFVWHAFVFSQNQSITINVTLDTIHHQLDISQKTVFYNYSKDTLNTLYLHNWLNSYKDKNTPLSKRLLEDYDKSLYFAKTKHRGYSQIKSIHNHHQKLKIDESIADIVKVILKKPLLPKDTILLEANYTIKIPKSKFTQYGYHKKEYDLRFWYLSPAVYKNHTWQTMSNYNMDDLYSYPTDYKITFTIPQKFNLESNLIINNQKTVQNNTTYFLQGVQNSEAEIIIYQNRKFIEFQTPHNNIVTNLTNQKIKPALANDIARRQILFIEDYLGQYPHKKLLINKIGYDKNPVYGLNQLPSILNPFDELFKYDIQLFKALTNTFINTSLISNRRHKYWINDGIQTYLMLKYIEKYYPEKKALGVVSKLWGVRSYKIAQLSFNDKYAFVYQFAMRKNIDQSLSTTADSLSTFNRKIVNKYKAGLGLVYLQDYLGGHIIQQSIRDYYANNKLAIKTHHSFEDILKPKTSKNLDWFFTDYIHSDKKIDYTIKKVRQVGDSLAIEIKNTSNFTAPISIYGIKNKQIISKKWFANISDFSTVTIPKGDFDRISLNYEAKYPELNLNDNWKNLKPSLFNKPFQFRFMKDVDNPYYNQVFYNVDYDYNYYDGIILGGWLSNKTLFKKKWFYRVHPKYGFKSKEIKGSFLGRYLIYPKSPYFQKLTTGFVYSTYNYDENLNYQRLSPYLLIDFKRKNLRGVENRYFSTRYLMIKKEVDKSIELLQPNSYAVLNMTYGYYNPEIIHNLNYNFDFQTARKFGKLNFEIQYRKLRKNNSQIDLRVFAGTFLYNNESSGFYDYSLNRSSDYMFDYSYFGRSEDTGFLSQQFIMAEGGFKSLFKENSANQWMFTFNNSVGIWRWVEAYSDFGFYKNRGTNPQFKYDSGIRLNFVQNFFEVYFPIQSSNGFEIQQDKYPEKIRFVMTLNLNKIYSFIKRGFY